MKRLYLTLIIVGASLIIAPVGYFIFESNTTEFLLALAFIVYPLVSIALGVIASADFKKLWWATPVISLAFPLLGWAFVGTFEIGYILYATIYSVLFFITIGIVKLINSTKKRV